MGLYSSEAGLMHFLKIPLLYCVLDTDYRYRPVLKLKRAGLAACLRWPVEWEIPPFSEVIVQALVLFGPLVD